MLHDVSYYWVYNLAFHIEAVVVVVFCQLFNSGYDTWLPSRKYIFFQLNNTWKGKLINQIESKSRMRSTFVWIHVQSYHCPIY